MTHIVTGATGFVGSALTLELLLRTDEPVIGIVRPREGTTATARLQQVLAPLVEGYELPAGLLDAIEQRVTALPGDLEQPHCGLDRRPTRFESDTPNLVDAEFWHCAASLQYQDRHQEAIDRTNIGGTANALDLAETIRARRFNMVSTAYVAGSQRGIIKAIPGELDLVNNLYERSKVVAEQQVRDRDLVYRIMRPSVVIGHSVTRHTTSSDGLYGFLRGLRKFRAVLDRTSPGLADELRVRMLAHAEGSIDLVPIDHVVADAVGLSLADAPTGHYHLSNPTAPNIGDAIGAAFDAAGLRPPLVVKSREGFTSTDTKLSERVDYYNSYIVNAKRFDRSAVEAVLGDEAKKGCVLDSPVLGSFCRWYLDDFERTRTGLQAVR